MMVDGPASPPLSATSGWDPNNGATPAFIEEKAKTFAAWAGRNTKRPLENVDGASQDKQTVFSTSALPIFSHAVPREQQN